MALIDSCWLQHIMNAVCGRATRILRERLHSCNVVSSLNASCIAAPVYMPPDDMKMTRAGAERFSTGSSSRVRWKAPSVLVARLSSSPSADVELPLLDCSKHMSNVSQMITTGIQTNDLEYPYSHFIGTATAATPQKKLILQSYAPGCRRC